MNNTLVKGLQLLELLVRSEQPAGVTELSASLGMGKSNVHRLLQALVELRYVDKDESTSEYSASLKIWGLGNLLSAKLSIRNVAAPAMGRLLLATRETVHLSVLDGDEVVYLHKLNSPEPVRSYAEIGGRAPAYCVATGKALLAGESPLRIKSLILESHTPTTITSPEALDVELAKVRANGYAVNRGEWRESVWGVAAPICGVAGTVVAAIGISGPAIRVKQSQIKKLAAEVVEAAKTVEQGLRES